MKTRVVSDGFLSASELKGIKVLVLGLGVSGRSVARALVGCGAEVFASDTNPEALLPEGVEGEIGSHREASRRLAWADLVVPSPGIVPTTDVLSRAISEGLPTISEVELASRFTSTPVIAITGTNGKTTTTSMVAAIFQAAGKTAVSCGNIGNTFIDAVEKPADVYVVEVSSFQLSFCHGFKPKVAVITNFAPDHLDWHGTSEGYLRSKGRITARQTRGDWYIYPHAQPELRTLAPRHAPRIVSFGLSDPGDQDGVWCHDGRIKIRVGSEVAVDLGTAAAPALRGAPFVADAMAAAAAAVALGVEPEIISETLDTFEVDKHRMEFVAEIRGVSFIDDSKATNPHAVAAALDSLESAVLIAGGRNKGLPLADLRRFAPKLRGVVAFGESSAEVHKTFSDLVEVKVVDDVVSAVRSAFEFASQGDTVLLSPACSSWDQFRNYAERGDAFRKAVEELR